MLPKMRGQLYIGEVTQLLLVLLLLYPVHKSECAFNGMSTNNAVLPSSVITTPLSPLRPDAPSFMPMNCCNTDDGHPMPPNRPTDEQLRDFLLAEGIMQTEAENATMKNIVKRLTDHLREKVDEGIECHASGSQYMDVALSNRTEFGSDLDIVCTVPVLKRRDDIMKDFYKALLTAKNENSSIVISEDESEAIRYSAVPTIKLYYKLPNPIGSNTAANPTKGEKSVAQMSGTIKAGTAQEVVEVDIAFARVKPSAGIPPKEPETKFTDWLLDDERVYAAVDFAKPDALDKEKSKEERVGDREALVDYTTLNGLRNLADLRRTAENKCAEKLLGKEERKRCWESFRLAVIVNKWWAKKMGISDHVYGYPPPLAWTTMILDTMIKYFRPGKSATEMVVNFHRRQWKWFLNFGARHSIQAEMTQLKGDGGNTKVGKLPQRDDGPVVVKLPYTTTLKNPPRLLVSQVWEPMKEIVGGGQSIMGVLLASFPQGDVAMNVAEPQLLRTHKYIKDGGLYYLAPNSRHLFTYEEEEEEELPDGGDEDGGGKKKKKLTSFPLFEQKPSFVRHNYYFVVVVVESESVERHRVVAQFAGSKIHELTKSISREHLVSTQGLRITPYAERLNFPQQKDDEPFVLSYGRGQALKSGPVHMSGGENANVIKVHTKRSSFFLFSLHTGMQSNVRLDIGDSLGDFANTINRVGGTGKSAATSRSTVHAFCYDTTHDFETLGKLDLPALKACITEPVVELAESTDFRMGELIKKMHIDVEAKERVSELASELEQARMLAKSVERKISTLLLPTPLTPEQKTRKISTLLLPTPLTPEQKTRKQETTRRATDAKENLSDAIIRTQHYEWTYRFYQQLADAKALFASEIDLDTFDPESGRVALEKKLGGKINAARKIYTDYKNYKGMSAREKSALAVQWPKRMDSVLIKAYDQLGELIDQATTLLSKGINEQMLIRDMISTLENGLPVTNKSWTDVTNISEAKIPYNNAARSKLNKLLADAKLAKEDKRLYGSVMGALQKVNTRLDTFVWNNNAGGAQQAGNATAARKRQKKGDELREKKLVDQLQLLRELVDQLPNVHFFGRTARDALRRELATARQAIEQLSDKHASLCDGVKSQLEKVDELVDWMKTTYTLLPKAPAVVNLAKKAWEALEKEMGSGTKKMMTVKEEERWKAVVAKRFEVVRHLHNEHAATYSTVGNVYAAVGWQNETLLHAYKPDVVENLKEMVEETRAFNAISQLFEKEQKIGELLAKVKNQGKAQMVDNDLCVEIDAEQTAVAELVKGFADEDTKPAYSKVVARHSALMASNLETVLLSAVHNHNGELMEEEIWRSMRALHSVSENVNLREVNSETATMPKSVTPDAMLALKVDSKKALTRANRVLKDVDELRQQIPPRLVAESVKNEFNKSVGLLKKDIASFTKEKYEPLCGLIEEKESKYKSAAENRIRTFHKAAADSAGPSSKERDSSNNSLGPSIFHLSGGGHLKLHAELQLTQSKQMSDDLVATWTLEFDARPMEDLYNSTTAASNARRYAEAEMNLALKMRNYILRNEEGIYKIMWSESRLVLTSPLANHEIDMEAAAERCMRLLKEVIQPGIAHLTNPRSAIKTAETKEFDSVDSASPTTRQLTYCSQDLAELARLTGVLKSADGEQEWALDEQFCLRSNRFTYTKERAGELSAAYIDNLLLKQLKLARVPVEFVDAEDAPLKVKVPVESEMALLEVIEGAVKHEKDKGKIRKVLVRVAKSALANSKAVGGFVPYYLVVYSPISKRVALHLMQRVADQQLFIHFIADSNTTTTMVGEKTPSQATFKEIAEALESGLLNPQSIVFVRPYPVETATAEEDGETKDELGNEQDPETNKTTSKTQQPQYLNWSTRMDLPSNTFIQAFHTTLLAASSAISHSVNSTIFTESRRAAGWVLANKERLVLSVLTDSPTSGSSAKKNFPITIVVANQSVAVDALRLSYLVSGKVRADEVVGALDVAAQELRDERHPLSWNIERAFAVKLKVTMETKNHEDDDGGEGTPDSDSPTNGDMANSWNSSTSTLRDENEVNAEEEDTDPYEIVLADYASSSSISGYDNGEGSSNGTNGAATTAIFTLEIWKKLLKIVEPISKIAAHGVLAAADSSPSTMMLSEVDAIKDIVGDENGLNRFPAATDLDSMFGAKVERNWEDSVLTNEGKRVYKPLLWLFQAQASNASQHMVVEASEHRSVVKRGVLCALNESLLEAYIVDYYGDDGEDSTTTTASTKSYLIASFPLHAGNHTLQPHGTDGQLPEKYSPKPITVHSLHKLVYALNFIGSGHKERRTVFGRDKVEELLARKDMIRLRDAIIFPYLLPEEGKLKQNTDTGAKLVDAIKRLGDVISNFFLALTAFRPKLRLREGLADSWSPATIDLQVGERSIFLNYYPQNFDEWSTLGSKERRIVVRPTATSQYIINIAFPSFCISGEGSEGELFPLLYWPIMRESTVTDETTLLRKLKLGAMDQLEMILDAYRVRVRTLYGDGEGDPGAKTGDDGGGDRSQQGGGATSSSRKKSSRRSRRRKSSAIITAAVGGSTEPVLRGVAGKSNSELVAEALEKATNNEVVKFLLYNPDKEDPKWSVAEAILIKTDNLQLAVHFLTRLSGGVGSGSGVAANDSTATSTSSSSSSSNTATNYFSLPPVHMVYTRRDRNGYLRALNALSVGNSLEAIKAELWPSDAGAPTTTPRVGFLAVVQLANSDVPIPPTSGGGLMRHLRREETAYRREALSDDPHRWINRAVLELDLQIKLGAVPIVKYMQTRVLDGWLIYEGMCVFMEEVMLVNPFNDTLLFRLTFLYMARSLDEAEWLRAEWGKIMEEKLEEESKRDNDAQLGDDHWVLREVPDDEMEYYYGESFGERLVPIATANIISNEATGSSQKMALQLAQFGKVVETYTTTIYRLAEVGKMAAAGHKILHSLEDIDALVAAAPLVQD